VPCTRGVWVGGWVGGWVYVLLVPLAACRVELMFAMHTHALDVNSSLLWHCVVL